MLVRGACAAVRTILHSDLNNFYASVEILKHPELKNMPVAVCGNREERHGIVLAKNMLAKAAGVQTGDVYWQAKKKCLDLVELPADFSSYLRVSKEVRKIYERYSDCVEAFGIDECWIDVTDSEKIFGGGAAIAEQIRRSIKREIGITVSVGVSWNKIFAKLGSDLKKPDAVTVITPENYKTVVWPLPVEEMLYVGKATKRKLNLRGIRTIGDLAAAEEQLLAEWLGKWGSYLHIFANGLDNTPVCKKEEERNIKSIGNSLTNYRDLTDEEEVHMLLLLLSDSVAARLRESNFGKAKTVAISVTDSMLMKYGKQGKLPLPSRSAADIADAAFNLFREIYPWVNPVRALGVSVRDFSGPIEQMDFFTDVLSEKKTEELEKAVDTLRKKYGNNIIQRAAILKDEKLRRMDIKAEHVIHPENFFGK